MIVKPSSISAPTRKDKLVVRLMILIGLFAVAFFMYTLLQDETVGYRPLYILLMITLFYYCLKYLHEWYHYYALSVPKKPERKKIYTVDILTTYCAGEPFDMLEQTLTAIQQVTYPHTTWCCDEADDPAVKALCNQLGVRHVTRTIKKNAKAGNINNALQFATGELCVVMDPDHIPCPEFLDYVVDYFNDPAIGFVQVVQAYYNQHESLVAKGAAQQTYQFYGPMMMCMNTYGTVQAIGANCTFRRAALDDIGGHAAGLSEDMHTAMQIHAKGWKSMYVPAILTRGLVPATLSSYYKQQLKWSRGTWELLVATYPKLFTRFNWRQKLHYFTLPFHYLSGIIFFINFLIPVVSLFTGYIPLKMDVLAFSLAALPLFAMTIIIRHYVQKWVAEENERGFHIVGGILQIGAWWVHSVGFIYTLLRKKVPYIPTPKNDNDALPLVLNIPNIIIAAISLIAIFYGFNYNYNPYTLFMAILASMQVFFMVFIFSVSGYTSNDGKVETIAKKLRQNTWLIVKAHGVLRKYSVILAVLVLTLFIIGYRQTKQLPDFLPKPIPGLQVFYNGLYNPTNTSGFSNTTTAFKNTGNQPAIVSFYVATDQQGYTFLPTDSLPAVYNHQAIPLINWQVTGAFAIDSTGPAEGLLLAINSGNMDAAISQVANQLASLNKPVFLRPSFTGFNIQQQAYLYSNTNPLQYIAAWKHLHQLFEDAGAHKVIWIWNPVNPAMVEDFFPGSAYADWLGVSIVDNTNNSSYRGETEATGSFYMRYNPYHQTKIFQAGLPVMITEAGSLSADKANWWKRIPANIDTSFNEIKSLVISNTAYNNNQGYSINSSLVLQSLPSNSLVNELSGSSVSKPKDVTSSRYYWPDSIKAMVYDKGYYWFRNRHTMTQKTLEADIVAIKKIGVNTIERTMPGFYDDVLGTILKKNSIRLIARLAVQLSPAVVDDPLQSNAEKLRILHIIRKNNHRKNIIAWNIGDDQLFNLENETYKPGLFVYQNKYLVWLQDLCNQIRALDTTRPIVTDLNWDSKGEKRFNLYRTYVPQINTCLLTATTKYIEGLKKPLQAGMAWGKVPPELWKHLPAIKKAGTVPAWQDIENTDYITLNGLLDLDGRRKDFYRIVNNTWTANYMGSSPIPEIKILKPLKLTKVNEQLTYHIMLRKDSTQWSLYNDAFRNYKFEWYMVRVDRYGITMFIKKIGEGTSISLPIPKEPQYYELYVEAVYDRDVRMARSTLNTPLN
ncbi:MAG: hypothetical protein RL172_1105 [Bacteroidota bacterium]